MSLCLFISLYLYLSIESFDKLQHHLEQLHIVGIFDFTLNTSPQTLPLYFSKLSLKDSILFNPIISDHELDTEGTIFGMWGPPLHPSNNHTLNLSQSSGRILYLILKCQSLYQTMNSVVTVTNSSNTTEAVETITNESNQINQSNQSNQCTLKCATMISLLSHSLLLFTDIPISRPTTAPSSHYLVQQQSSHIITLFINSLSESCKQLMTTNQSKNY